MLPTSSGKIYCCVWDGQWGLAQGVLLLLFVVSVSQLKLSLMSSLNPAVVDLNTMLINGLKVPKGEHVETSRDEIRHQFISDKSSFAIACTSEVTRNPTSERTEAPWTCTPWTLTPRNTPQTLIPWLTHHVLITYCIYFAEITFNCDAGAIKLPDICSVGDGGCAHVR